MTASYETHLISNWRKAEQLARSFGITDNKSVLLIWNKITYGRAAWDQVSK